MIHQFGSIVDGTRPVACQAAWGLAAWTDGLDEPRQRKSGYRLGMTQLAGLNHSPHTRR